MSSGMDFLSMAMVYKTAVPENSQYETEDDVYAAWWKYYMTRWNYLLPEIPLYSNEYYDVYNAKIKGVDEHPTNPYWGPAKALIDWTSEKADNDIIIGNTTDLSGKFRYSPFGGSNPGAADLDVDNLINGLETVATTKEGGFEVNKTVVKQLDKVENEDGTLTYTITLNDGLAFSDGTPVTAKNYLYFPMVFSTLVAAEAEGKDRQAGLTMAGFEEFNAYDGTNEGDGVSKTFAGPAPCWPTTSSPSPLRLSMRTTTMPSAMPASPRSSRNCGAATTTSLTTAKAATSPTASTTRPATASTWLLISLLLPTTPTPPMRAPARMLWSPMTRAISPRS